MSKQNITTGIIDIDIHTPNNMKFEKMDEISTSIFELLEKNIWYSYLQNLYERNKIKSENWIGFESEISVIIEYIDKNCDDLLMDIYTVLLTPSHKVSANTIEKKRIFEEVFSIIYRPPGVVYKEITVKNFRKILNGDLKRLTEAFEIYLSNIVENQPVDCFSNDLMNLFPDYVINFNYTNTFSKIYKYNKPEFHIHGSCRKNKYLEKNNMVLGIGEYWPEDECKDHTNFTVFKKFAQRILKRTGKNHFEILNELIDWDFDVHIYVFGHSLDATDKDILNMFFEYGTFKITIFCMDEETEGEYIANMIRIIGEKELIKRVNLEPPTLEFVLQTDMKPVISINEKDEEEFPSTL